MATAVYGTDVQALTSLPDPEILCSENTAAAYQVARRLATPSGALQEIGEVQQYDSIDVRDWLGAHFNLADPAVLNDLGRQGTEVVMDDPFVQTAQVVATFNQGTITLSVQGQGANGPFSFVVNASSLGVQILLPGQV